MVSFEDKDVAIFLIQHGRLLLAVLLLLLVVLIYLNIKLWRRRRRTNEADESFIDWSQNLDEIEIDVPLPPGVKSKDVDCRITSTYLRFAFRNEPSPLLEVRIKAPTTLPNSCYVRITQTLVLCCQSG